MSLQAPSVTNASVAPSPLALRDALGHAKSPVAQNPFAPSAKAPVSKAGLAAAKYQQSGAETISNERLVVMLYERLLRDIDTAEAEINNGNPALAHTQLVHAQSIVEALQISLDISAWGGGSALYSLYDYCHELLVKANMTKNATVLVECRNLIEPIAFAWEDAWKQLTTASGINSKSGEGS